MTMYYSFSMLAALIQEQKGWLCAFLVLVGWLDYPESTPVEKDIQGSPHMSFGAGARACSGQFVANRVIYTALVRLLNSYRVVASEEFSPTTDYVDYNATKSALVAIPKGFKVKAIPRDESALLACLERGAKRTDKHYLD